MLFKNTFSQIYGFLIQSSPLKTQTFGNPSLGHLYFPPSLCHSFPEVKGTVQPTVWGEAEEKSWAESVGFSRQSQRRPGGLHVCRPRWRSEGLCCLFNKPELIYTYVSLPQSLPSGTTTF